MTDKQRTEIIGKINSVEQLCNLNSIQIQNLTDDFDEFWVRYLLDAFHIDDELGFCNEKEVVLKMQRYAFEIVREAWDSIYEEIVPKPEFFDLFEISLAANIPIELEDVESNEEEEGEEPDSTNKAETKRSTMTAEEAETDFCKCVHDTNLSEKIVKLLHKYIDGQEKPKGIMRPIRAAMEAGVIARPDLNLFNATFKKKVSKTRFNEYTKKESIPDAYLYDKDFFDSMVKAFKEIAETKG